MQNKKTLVTNMCNIQKNIIILHNSMKKRAQRRRKHCMLAVVRRSQPFSPRRRPSSAGDGHYLHLQTEFGEDRCTQFRVIVVTNPQTNKQTNTQTDRGDYNTLQLSVQCNNSLSQGRHLLRLFSKKELTLIYVTTAGLPECGVL